MPSLDHRAHTRSVLSSHTQHSATDLLDLLTISHNDTPFIFPFKRSRDVVRVNPVVASQRAAVQVDDENAGIVWMARRDEVISYKSSVSIT
jgi:hypothetical protein